jgi:hypothetical protein
MFESLVKLSATLKNDNVREEELVKHMNVAHNKVKLYAEASKDQAKKGRRNTPDCNGSDLVGKIRLRILPLYNILGEYAHGHTLQDRKRVA